MSGTSADAVDAAVVRVGGPGEVELLALHSEPLEEELRRRIHGLVQGSVALRELLQLDALLGERFAAAALAAARAAGVRIEDVRGIGSHGQTVAHHPEREVRGSLQLASAAVIHARTGRPVVSDFRSADIAAGGQGAPLTPFFHFHRFASAGERRAVLNVGGFTNVTYLPDRDPAHVIAFDPGPGNALVDRAPSRSKRSRPLLAQRARTAVLARGGGADDVFASLLELTVESVARAAEQFFPALPERWLLCGGGARNPVLVERLAARLAPVVLEPTDAHGVPSEALEAIAFAVLGHCASRGEPSNLPAATGAAHAVPLGVANPPGAFRGLD